jgi:pyrroline-5-carboxylate reductase
MKIAFIGGGKMGEAIIRAVMEGKISPARDITVSDISESRRLYLKKQYGIGTTADNKKAVAGRDVIILAVKPQNINGVLADLQGTLKSGQLVLSIAAGVKINSIRNGAGHPSIVRAMPNTPAQIGLGMSGWTAAREVTPKQKQWAEKILGAMGKEIYFSSEKHLDMVTAISGSGPAYLYLFAESMIEAAVGLGLKRKDAEKLVIQTVLGAAQMMDKTGKTPAELRRDVTSKGGTTERAVKVLEESKLALIISRAVKAAYERSKELG